MKSKNVIFCDGGLCNRLNTLLFGLILQKKMGGTWELSWPVNEWCGVDFEELFIINMPTNTKPLDYYKKNEKDYLLIMHENQAQFNEENIIYHSSLNTLEDYQKVLLETSRPLFYYNNLIPNCTETSDIKSVISELVINPEIFDIASNFCIENKIDNSVLGLHIRKTDFGNLVDDDALFSLASQSNHIFFVCSDDQFVNDRFSKLANCYVYKKSAFPEKKMSTDSWNSVTIDNQGRSFNFNIVRPGASIKEALIDLLILSQTTQILTSHSTFLKMSMVMKSTDFFNPGR
jgi:hypothetical protein